MTGRVRAARIVAIAVAFALAALVVARCRQPDPAPVAATATSPAASARAPSRSHPSPPPPGFAAGLPPTAPPPPSMDPAASRKERARFTLASYLDWAQYPPTSRPARERPDRQRPHAAPPRSLPLRSSEKAGATGRASSRTTVVLSQSHYFLAGDEAAVLTVSCRQGDAPAPCTVTGAVAEPGPGATGRAGAAAPFVFADDGASPDVAAHDNAWTAPFSPAKQGLGGVSGPIAITVTVDAGGEQGTADFQLSYTGAPPAVFTGAVSEALEKGSLRLCVEMSVTDAGRYVLDGRVDDASGETFAFVSYNDVLAAGKQQACFTVFGKLILDEGVKSPFSLRDVEGFLLLEDAFPDRRTMPTLEGRAHTTKAYGSGDFSKDEWQSPTKDRYVTQLKKDAEAGD